MSITVGGQGGTSSVTCPSQSPTSPISATGGSDGGTSSPSPSPTNSPTPGGAGGSGSGTVPSPRSGLLWTADGGQGSPRKFCTHIWRLLMVVEEVVLVVSLEMV